MSVDTLQAKIRKKKFPAVLPLDLRPELLPALGGTPAEVCREAGLALLEGLADRMPAVRFRTAYYDALGPEGPAVLAALCARAKALGYYRIVETDRCSLEDAAALEARTYFGALEPDGAPSPFDADAVCVSPFSGSDGVRPFLPYCRERGHSVFLLARTPNRSARELQDLIAGDRVVHTVVADLAMRLSTDLFADSGYSEVGLVLGLPRCEALQTLRRQYDRLFFLIPGCGGAGPAVRDARGAFDRFGHGAAVEAAGIAAVWLQPDGQPAGLSALVEQARAAADKLRDELARQVTVI